MSLKFSIDIDEFDDVEMSVMVCLTSLKTKVPIKTLEKKQKKVKFIEEDVEETPKDGEYVVNHIDEHRYINGYLMFRTYWRDYKNDYGEMEYTYEPRESFKIEGTRKYIDVFTQYCKAKGLTL